MRVEVFHPLFNDGFFSNLTKANIEFVYIWECILKLVFVDRTDNNSHQIGLE